MEETGPGLSGHQQDAEPSILRAPAHRRRSLAADPRHRPRFPQNAFQPKWAPAPLLKQRERTFPQLGFPRETDSLCPRCVKEVRTEILSGKADWKVLVDGNPGEIKATIVEERRRRSS